MRRVRKEEREVKPKIIYEDEALLVIDKPAGIVVDRASTFKGACHRLDKETSGLLIIAKTPSVFIDIQQQFKQREVEKKYLALVHGRVKPSCGKISFPVGRNPFNRKKFGVFLGGREAQTRYKRLRYYDIKGLGTFSLLQITPLTGRTHQIRVHLKNIGHPIVGDLLYGGRKQARADRKWCKRQFLHASYLRFTHPQSGKPVEFYSSLADDLEEVLSMLPGKLMLL